MAEGIETIEVITDGIRKEIEAYMDKSKRLTEDIATQHDRERNERRQEEKRDKQIKDMIMVGCPDLYLKGGRGEKEPKREKSERRGKKRVDQSDQSNDRRRD